MGLALDLAQKAAGATFPNPLVGACVVKNGKLVGQGFHKKAGGPHAEILALRQAGRKSRGAALYCTLEPCAHYGRTGPCADAIIRAGIKKVYIGMVDPNPLTRGRGLKKLSRSGIKVRSGIMGEKAAALNRPFIKAMTKGLPQVTIKIAESIDGKIATAKGESKWITGVAARAYGHALRDLYDGIMVGINTVIKDDPGLEPGRGHKLVKIVVDSYLKIPPGAKLLNTQQPVIVVAIRKNRRKEEALRKKGAQVIYAKPKGTKVDLCDLLRHLCSFELRNILVEGGAELIGSLLDEKLADHALVFIAPKIIGGSRALTSVGGRGIDRLSRAVFLENTSFEKIKEDILIRGDLKYYKGTQKQWKIL